MIDRNACFHDIASAVNSSDVELVLRRAGAVHMFWQTWSPDFVYTWDRTLPGFFSTYYGLDADKYCAIANAMRSGWISYTFHQAREKIGLTSEARDVETIWNNFGMKDGVCVMQGYADRRSLLVVGSQPGMAEAMLNNYQMIFAAAAAKIDMLFRDKLDTLSKTARAFRLLSPAEMKVVQAQIDFPHLTAREQANMLGISPRTLQRRHGDIAKKLGVSTFPGALVVALDRVDERISRSESQIGVTST